MLPESMENKMNLSVGIRVRPFSLFQIQSGNTSPCVDCKGSTVRIFRPEEIQEYKQFVFDDCYWDVRDLERYMSPEEIVNADFANQRKIFDKVGTQMINNALDGKNGCIIAYGPSSTGKTHSILEGNQQSPGLARNFGESLFTVSNSPEIVKRAITILQVYNEQVFDLLDDSANRKPLKVREKNAQTYVQGLKEIEFMTNEECQKLISLGYSNRSFNTTTMSCRSNRAHLIFSFILETKNQQNNGLKSSITHFVDLAGSQRIGKTGANSIILKEVANISKSLGALGLVVDAKVNNSKHIPFRDSKLTYILKNAFVLDFKLYVLGTISPSHRFYEENLSTMRFISRMRKLRVKNQGNQ